MKKRVIYLQEDTYSCGACCIQSVVSYYGGYVPLETVLDDTNTDSLGTNAYELTKALKKYGFSSYGKEESLKEVKKSDLPVIAHVTKNGLEHFLVIYEIDENYVITMDPEKGEERYSKKNFSKIFDNKLVFAFKEGEIPKYRKSKTIFNTLIYNFNLNKLILFSICILCLLILTLNLFTSFHFKFLETTADPFKITLLFVIAKIVLYMFSIGKDALISVLVSKTDMRLTTDFIRHIFYLPRRFLLRKQTGGLVKKINDASFIKDLVLKISVVNTIDFLMILTAGFMLFKISSKLAFFCLGISVLVSMLSVAFDKRTYKKNKSNLEIYDEYMGTLVENINGLESIKNLNSEEYSLNKIGETFNRHVYAKRKMDFYLSLIENTKALIIDTGLILVNLVGFMSLNETFTLYDLLTLQSIFGLFVSSLESILNTHYHLISGKALYKRCSEILDIEEEKCEGRNIKDPFDNICVKDLTYSYDGIHNNILKLNVDIFAGQKILLRGPSGIGKSTFVKCLCGMLEDYTGEIFINGVEIKEVPKKELRKRMVYISQEEKLFAGSIKENITLGDDDEENFKRVIKICSLDKMISERTEGENATILEGATNLSGGERARVILARALYRNPSVLVIDETLSSVAEEMEDSILNRLLEIKDLTVIYITHRKKDHLFKNIINLERKDDDESKGR